MPFVEVFTREELSDAVRAKLAEVEYIEIQNNARRVVCPWVMGAGPKRRCFLPKYFPAI